jgi:NADPH2:quinone reductase
MKYVEYGAGGAPEVMTVADGPKPELRPGGVTIEVYYAGVNGPDIMQRKALYPPPPGASPILGLEVAGRVAEVAPDVTTLHVGDMVCALTAGGGYAEYCYVDASNCLPVPKGLSVKEAAGIPETFFTVWTNVFERGALKAGETFLVHGGSGGIGTTAVQLAHAFGARVFTTAGSAEKVAFCKTIGADVAINYREQDFVAEVLRVTENAGVDVILDMIGAAYFEQNFGLLAHDGRMVQIAVRQGATAPLNLGAMMMRRLTFTGSTLRPRTVEKKAAIARELEKNVWPLFESGKVKSIIHATFPLERVVEAHQMMEDSTHIGKIVLEVKAPAYVCGRARR